jgi:hypothetical protein
MIATVGRVSLAAAMVLGLAGASLAREGHPARGKMTGKGFAMPKYEANARVAGPERPYAWPVADRYRPVSQPFYGRAY